MWHQMKQIEFIMHYNTSATTPNVFTLHNSLDLPKIHIFYIYWINIYNKNAKLYNDRGSFLRWRTNLCNEHNHGTESET